VKTCPQCSRQYRDDSLKFCLEDGVPLTFEGRGSTTIRIPAARSDRHCNREKLFAQAAVTLSPVQLQALQIVLDAAPHFGYSVNWGRGKSCAFSMQHPLSKKGSLLSLNSKGELWLAKGAKGALAAMVADALQIKVPKYDQWFLIRPHDWVPKSGRLLHLLSSFAYQKTKSS